MKVSNIKFNLIKNRGLNEQVKMFFHLHRLDSLISIIDNSVGEKRILLKKIEDKLNVRPDTARFHLNKIIDSRLYYYEVSTGTRIHRNDEKLKDLQAFLLPFFSDTMYEYYIYKFNPQKSHYLFDKDCMEKKAFTFLFGLEKALSKRFSKVIPERFNYNILRYIIARFRNPPVILNRNFKAEKIFFQKPFVFMHDLLLLQRNPLGVIRDSLESALPIGRRTINRHIKNLLEQQYFTVSQNDFLIKNMQKFRKITDYLVPLYPLEFRRMYSTLHMPNKYPWPKFEKESNLNIAKQLIGDVRIYISQTFQYELNENQLKKYDGFFEILLKEENGLFEGFL